MSLQTGRFNCQYCNKTLANKRNRDTHEKKCKKKPQDDIEAKPEQVNVKPDEKIDNESIEDIDDSDDGRTLEEIMQEYRELLPIYEEARKKHEERERIRIEQFYKEVDETVHFDFVKPIDFDMTGVSIEEIINNVEHDYNQMHISVIRKFHNQIFKNKRNRFVFDYNHEEGICAVYIGERKCLDVLKLDVYRKMSYDIYNLMLNQLDECEKNKTVDPIIIYFLRGKIEPFVPHIYTAIEDNKLYKDKIVLCGYKEE